MSFRILILLISPLIIVGHLAIGLFRSLFFSTLMIVTFLRHGTVGLILFKEDRIIAMRKEIKKVEKQISFLKDSGII